jgi:hypothetical protein
MADESSEKIEHAPMCNCPIHRLIATTVEFVEMLVDDAAKKKVDDWMRHPEKCPAPEKMPLDSLRSAILIGAIVEIYYKHNANPVTIMQQVSVYWNKKVARQIAYEDDKVKFIARKDSIDQEIEELGS